MEIATKHIKLFKPAERKFSSFLLFLEDLFKVPVFGCQKCGECLLSHTALICSQRCAKRLRNGPCGGTRPNGYCEVFPERKCVWYRIYHRNRLWKRLILVERIECAHNWELEKTSAWLNVFTRRIDPPTIFIRRKRQHESE